MELATYEFPTEAVRCKPGDYLLCESSGGKWVAYQVEDLLLVKRLVHFGVESSLVLEENLLDSVAPAYLNEVHLLLTVLEPMLGSGVEAIDAIRTHQLTEKTRGLLRSAQEFAQSHCRVFHASDIGHTAT